MPGFSCLPSSNSVPKLMLNFDLNPECLSQKFHKKIKFCFIQAVGFCML